MLDTTFLVTGATGATGGAAAAQLLDKGRQVRAFVHREDAAAISKHQTSHAGVSVRHCHRRSSDAGRTADAARSPVETAPGGFAGNDLSFIAPR